MNNHWITNRPQSRREMLRSSSVGFGSLALANMLTEQSSANVGVSASPLAVRQPHFTAKAKRVIFMFMHGGPSQVDTFDYKPDLQKNDGRPFAYDKPRVVSSKTGNLLASPFKFKQHGESGIHIS